MTNKLLLASLVTLAIAPLASADVEFRLTGATAFRAAVHNGLKTGFFNGNFKFAHSSGAGSWSGSTRSIWQGPVAGYGTVTVRCFWTGSVAGTQNLAQGTQIGFLTTGTLPAGSSATGTENASQTATENLVAHAAFSDCYQSSTLFTTPSFNDDIVGVIPFTWVVNDTSATGADVLARYGFDNVTAQFARALLTTGEQPMSLLTGNPAHTRRIYSIGRDTGSGTRVIMLAETKYGVFSSLTNFQGTAASDVVSDLKIWPTTNAANGDDPIPGNGGYLSGGTAATLLSSKTDTTFTLTSQTGAPLGSSPNGYLISCVGISDSNTIVGGGGARLKYEGFGYSGTDDNAKVQNGQYTMWSYEHLLYGFLTADQDAIKVLIETSIDANMGSAGIQNGSMNVFRSGDGGVVAP